MSIAALAVRLATVYALRGKTVAGDDIKDSPQNPLPNPLKTIQLAIYTGREGLRLDGRELLGGEQSFDISIHMHAPAEVELTDGNQSLVLSARGGGAGVIFDVLWRQIVRALMVDSGKWAEVWRSFVVKIGDVDSEPFLIETEKGVRVQARDIVFPVETICDPAFGADLTGTPWALLLEAMRETPEVAPLADVIEHEIRSPDALPEWARLRASLGLTEGELAASGLAPLTTDMVEPSTEFTVDDEEAGPLVITETTP